MQSNRKMNKRQDLFLPKGSAKKRNAGKVSDKAVYQIPFIGYCILGKSIGICKRPGSEG